MKGYERAAYIRYRLDTAKDTLRAARVLAEHGFWNSAANRLYYAVFYAVNALLVANGVRTKSHTATKSQFAQHFIKSGKLDRKYGRLLSELFDCRQKGDYEAIFDHDERSVSPLFSPAEEMIHRIEQEIGIENKPQQVDDGDCPE